MPHSVAHPTLNPTTSHVQSWEQLHTEEVVTGNIDIYTNSIYSNVWQRDSVKSEESDDYEKRCLQTILDCMERKETIQI